MCLRHASTLRALYTRGRGRWLIALMAWMLPHAHHRRVNIIVMIITYLLALAGLSHVIAMSNLALTGEMTLLDAGGYLGPTWLGNVLAGSALTAALAHAQTAPKQS